MGERPSWRSKFCIGRRFGAICVRQDCFHAAVGAQHQSWTRSRKRILGALVMPETPLGIDWTEFEQLLRTLVPRPPSLSREWRDRLMFECGRASVLNNQVRAGQNRAPFPTSSTSDASGRNDISK